MSARNSYRKIAITNGLRSTNFVANPALTTSYNLTLPSAVPTQPGQSLISDTTGNLSWGSSVATISTYTGTTNPLTVATNVTGLLFTSTSSQINLYVAINATTNIYCLYSLKVYQKGSSSSWGLAYDVICDTDDVDPQIVFAVTSTGQIQYMMPNTLAGFTSVVMVWSLGTGISNTLTSLALSSTLNVGGLSTFTAGIQGTSLTLASATVSGSISSSVGSFLSLQNQTYTDTVTAASTTSTGNFSASYLGIPTLAATNTAVTTPTASTLTIAGPPIAGTNETITNAYSLNILTGNVNFAANLNVPTINGRALIPSCANYQHANAIALSATYTFVYAYPANTGIGLTSSKGSDASNMLQTNGRFVAASKGLYTVSWTGSCPTVTAFYVAPIVSMYALTVAQVNNVSFLPSYVGNSSATPQFTATLSLMMAIGDYFVLGANANVSVQNVSISIICQPMGAF